MVDTKWKVLGTILFQMVSITVKVKEKLDFLLVQDVFCCLTVLDRAIVDEWVKCEDKSSFITARRLLRDEGLFCGGSSGSNVYAALQVAKRLKKGQRCVVMLPDSIRNYMTKHLSNDWMYKHGYSSVERNIGVPEDKAHGEWWTDHKVSELPLPIPYTIGPNVTCKEAIHVLAGEGYDQIPVVSKENDVLGVVTEGNLSAKLMSGKVKADDSVTKALFKQFRVVSNDTTLSELASIFDYDHFALVVQRQRCFTGAGSEPEEKRIVSAVVTRIDLLKHLSLGQKQ